MWSDLLWGLGIIAGIVLAVFGFVYLSVGRFIGDTSPDAEYRGSRT